MPSKKSAKRQIMTKVGTIPILPCKILTIAKQPLNKLSKVSELGICFLIVKLKIYTILIIYYKKKQKNCYLILLKINLPNPKTVSVPSVSGPSFSNSMPSDVSIGK